MTTARRFASSTALSMLRSLAPNRLLTPIETSYIIERQATRLLQLAGVTEPPVSLEAVLDVLPRVVVRYVRGLRSSGRSEWTGIAWLILINKSDSMERRRFTIAHELGHIVYHPLRSSLVSGEPIDRRIDRIEVACSHFAACLLMPRQWVKRSMTERPYQNLDLLAQLYGVSRTTAMRRLMELGLIDPLEVKRLGEVA